MRKITILIPVAVVAVALLLSSVFVVDERQRALVLQFGQIRQVIEEPGLNFKIPFIQEVVYYDDRILSLDTAPIEVTPSDDRRLVVDAFARYRIVDAEQFRLAVGVGDLREGERLLEDILNPQIRAVLGSEGVTSNTILSSERAVLMERITEQARLDVLDVRLKQTELPQQNLAATFARMRAEREREATDERARGEEAAQRVRATADRTVVELVSEATRDAEIIRGEADAARNRIFAEAFGADQDFFEFYRSMTAYERALPGSNSSMVLSPDSAFFEFFADPMGGSLGAAPVAATPDAAPEEEVETPEEEEADAPLPADAPTVGQ